MKKQILFLFVCSLAYISSFSQGRLTVPIALFTQSRAFVLENDTVCFYDQSQGIVQSYHWFFEGGIPSESFDKNPKVIYPVHGTYSVKLEISNQSGSDKILKEKLIHAHKILFGDTINWPLPFDTLYTLDSGGYVSGTNYKHPLIIANYFKIPPYTIGWPHNLIGNILIDFKKISTGSGQIKLYVYDTLGPGGEPGNILRTKILEKDSIRKSINKKQLFNIDGDFFFNNTSIKYSYYIGIELPAFPIDTLAISSSIHQTTPNYAWVMKSDSTWQPFNDSNAYNKSVSLGIFPIMHFAINYINKTTLPITSIYPNPAQEKFTITLKDGSNLPGNLLQIFGIQGNKVKEVVFPKYQKSLQVSISDLQPGLYLGRIVGRNGESWGFRFVKEE